MLVPLASQKRAAAQVSAGFGPPLKKPKGSFNQASGVDSGGQVAAAWENGRPGHTNGVGEVRFADAGAAEQACQMSGTQLAGQQITVEPDLSSKDGTKITVTGLPSGLQWGVLKQHFSQCGEVLFADLKKNQQSAPGIGQVRFDSAETAQVALGLNGMNIGGYEIGIKAHAGSKDGSKLQLYNLPPGLEWKQLKDHFTNAGCAPVYAEASNVAQGTVWAEVRYDNPGDAQTAMRALNGSMLGGVQIFIQADPRSSDSSKLNIKGVPAGIEWQELKDHFNQVGPVAFAKVDNAAEKGKGKGKSFGGGFAKGGLKGMPGSMPMSQSKGCGKGGFGGKGGGRGASPHALSSLAAQGLTISKNGIIMQAH